MRDFVVRFSYKWVYVLHLNSKHNFNLKFEKHMNIYSFPESRRIAYAFDLSLATLHVPLLSKQIKEY